MGARDLNLAELRRDLADWMSAELVFWMGMSPHDAQSISLRVLDEAQRTDDSQVAFRQDMGVTAEPSESGMIGAAADVVTIARATPLCPGGKEWWNAGGKPLLHMLFEGRLGVEWRVAEALAGPFDVDVDGSWPDTKQFEIPVPPGLPFGAQFIGGDGMGGRVHIEVIERDGRRGARYVEGSSRNPTSKIWLAAIAEARAKTGK